MGNRGQDGEGVVCGCSGRRNVGGSERPGTSTVLGVGGFEQVGEGEASKGISTVAALDPPRLRRTRQHPRYTPLLTRSRPVLLFARPPCLLPPPSPSPLSQPRPLLSAVPLLSLPSISPPSQPRPLLSVAPLSCLPSTACSRSSLIHPRFSTGWCPTAAKVAMLSAGQGDALERAYVRLRQYCQHGYAVWPQLEHGN